MGIIFAWPSCTADLFTSDQTPLNRPMTLGEKSLFGSLSSFGAVIGTVIAGAFFDVIGRKASAVLAAMIYVVCWSLFLYE